MGAPGGGYFCENGHLVYNAHHHEVYYDEKVLKCDICDSTNIKFDIEWGDSDYQFCVSTSPIKTENGHFCPHCKLYHGEIHIYDVSLLFDNNFSKWEMVCPKCFENFEYLSGNADEGFQIFCKKCYVGYSYNIENKQLKVEYTDDDIFDYNKVHGE